MAQAKKKARRKPAGRKISGGKYKREKKKKKASLGRQQRTIKLEEVKRKTLRTRGDNEKVVLLNSNEINLIGKDKKSKKVKITNVIETPSNRFLARQNVLTKGAIVETPEGKAKITNRPSQEGSVQGVLIE
jgi:small subunit ribosomal protein S8e